MKDLSGLLKSLDSILKKKRGGEERKYQFNQDSDIRFVIIKYGIKRNPGRRENGWERNKAGYMKTS